MILLLALQGCLWIPAPSQKGGAADTSADEVDTGADTDDVGDTDEGGDSADSEPDSSVDTDTGGQADADGDGFAADVDCDDGDAAIHPGASEVCDGQDNDCDGDIDEDAIDAYSWTVDEDGDGHGGTSVVACTRPANVAAAGDCYDANADARPGQTGHYDVDRGDGSYDYDCDGVESPEHASYYRCAISTGSTYSWTAGWDGGPPACGSTSLFVESAGSASACPTPASTTAACR